MLFRKDNDKFRTDSKHIEHPVYRVLEEFTLDAYDSRPTLYKSHTLYRSVYTRGDVFAPAPHLHHQTDL